MVAFTKERLTERVMEINGLHTGLKAAVSEVVCERNTARFWGSGGLDVYATPAMAALMEKAALSAVAAVLPAGYSTVGTKLQITHSSASALGTEIHAEAELIGFDGRRLFFRVRSWDAAGDIGEGAHERFIIEDAKFMAKTGAKKKG
jgi:predicted thioesterase